METFLLNCLCANTKSRTFALEIRNKDKKIVRIRIKKIVRISIERAWKA